MSVRASAILDVEDFVAGLQGTARGIVRLQSSAGIISAWLITDDLIVVPSFYLANSTADTAYHCYYHARQLESIKATVVRKEKESVDGGPGLVTLMRLDTPLQGAALSLATESPLPGDQVMIVQHPEGIRSPKLSIGNVVQAEGQQLQYDAATQPGSSGSPVVNAQWQVIAIHESKKGTQGNEELNQGSLLTALLVSMRDSSAWLEIARLHKLVDVAAASQALASQALLIDTLAPDPGPSTAFDKALLQAAVLWQFDPGKFTGPERLALKPFIVDPEAAQWTLRTSERQRILNSAPLSVLREARGDSFIDHPGQATIDRILREPSCKLSTLPEAELPYWIQVVRWFERKDLTLPTPKEIDEELERRRVRSRLTTITGPAFQGRGVELAQLHSWYQAADRGPMVLTGIGGSGKSSLLARFALDLAPDTLLLWLDFDRPDLAPNDAESVLSIFSQQVYIQRNAFAGPPQHQPFVVQKTATEFAQALTAVLGPDEPVLVILDGFEVAQHFLDHNEIWKLLDVVLAIAPTLRVVVSGRAPVANLTLRGHKAQTMLLKGMATADAVRWLTSNGVTDAEQVEQIVKISECVPLFLKLAVQLVEKGDKIDLPKELPQALIKGFLYQRVLDRVIDARLRDIARHALVLRYLTEDVVAGVLGHLLPAGLTSTEVFALLLQELSLVSEEPQTKGFALSLPSHQKALYIRSDVRAATLRLLEMDDQARVRDIDRRAAMWYSQQPQNQVENSAELVYHRLRLNDLAGASQAWQENCARLLQDAVAEFEPLNTMAHQWLKDRLLQASTPLETHLAWENQLLEQLPDMIAHGNIAQAVRYLNERPERRADSRLKLYDAWLMWRTNNNAPLAREVLGSVSKIQSQDERDRAVLAAYLAVQSGGRGEARRLLRRLDRKYLWQSSPEGKIDLLAVQAAQVRLATDLETELDLAHMLDNIPSLVGKAVHYLTALDVILPSLVRKMGSASPLESFGSSIQLPLEPQPDQDLLQQLDSMRELMNPHALKLSVKRLSGRAGLELPRILPIGKSAKRTLTLLELVKRLAALSQRRWQLGTANLLQKATWDELFRFDAPPTGMALSVVSTLTAFRGQPLTSNVAGNMMPDLDNLVDWYMKRTGRATTIAAPRRRVDFALKVLEHEIKETKGGWVDLSWLEKVAESEKKGEDFYQFEENLFLNQLQKANNPVALALGLYLTGPDPLEMLCRKALHLPDHLAL
ncbi:trypsin-like peptidase domain-containing protein [Hymenobacter tenuis]